MMPHDLPAWQTVYSYFQRWQRKGVWEKIHTSLRSQLREISGRDVEPSAGIIDSQTVKTTEKGGAKGYDAGKKILCRKRHILVDTMGLILMVVVHAASIQDPSGSPVAYGGRPACSAGLTVTGQSLYSIKFTTYSPSYI